MQHHPRADTGQAAQARDLHGQAAHGGDSALDDGRVDTSECADSALQPSGQGLDLREGRYSRKFRRNWPLHSSNLRVEDEK